VDLACRVLRHRPFLANLECLANQAFPANREFRHRHSPDNQAHSIPTTHTAQPHKRIQLRRSIQA
jgi:hypothetical protein